MIHWTIQHCSFLARLSEENDPRNKESLWIFPTINEEHRAGLT
jgi:hypothetical protein